MSYERKPKQMYRVEADAKSAKGKLRMYEIKSKTYASKHHAVDHMERLAKRGVKSRLFESEPLVWHDITPEMEIEGQEELPLGF